MNRTPGDHPDDDGAHAGGAHTRIPAGRRPRPRRLLLLLWGLAAATYALDQLSKVWAVDQLTGRAPIALVGDLLQLRLIYNSGAALSLGDGMTWVLTLVATVVTVVILRATRNLGSAAWAAALGLLLGGAVGNLTDRFLRDPGFARGHVVDFIAYGDLFIGNVADIAIVVGAGLVVVQSLRRVGVDGSHTTAGGSAT